MATISPKSRAFVSASVSFAVAAFALATSHSVLADQAGPPSVQQIIEALKPRKTRGLSVKPTQAEIEKAKVIDGLASKASQGGLSAQERDELAEATAGNPQLDFVIYFDFAKATISKRSMATLDALGAALQDDALRGSSIMIAGHTDAKGRPEYNQTLSERRAAAVQDYLHDKFGLSTDSLTVVGYGAERLKVRHSPYAAENRRVQIVNITDKTASIEK